MKYTTTRSTKYKFVTNSIKVHGIRYDYSMVKYHNAKTKVWIGCEKHGFFLQTPNDHTCGKGCMKCSIEYNTNRQKSPQNFLNFKKKANFKFKSKFDYSMANYVNNKTHISIICPIHGIFYQRPDNHLNSRYGCEKCMRDNTQSKAVSDIETILSSFKYVREKRFDNCKNILTLPFDFYIEDLNLCIEYDGEQHFQCSEHWGGIKSLKQTQHNDKIKNTYCTENGINLLRLKYNEDYISVLKKYFYDNFNILLKD
ncbi:DUF723 domain-containing protein [Escherichia coli]|uniref:DUF723 domain-containing protein n=1 Tax=Escherichia coli TaxID=562 RepID=UPI001A5AEA4D|nr:DUF723 domain-containing protein [Escherichia coli]VVY07496.1 Uncharacterised protein [Escherichia coli]